MRVPFFTALLLFATGCEGFFDPDCGSYSPSNGDVLVLGQTADGGYEAYEDVVSWEVVEHTFTLGGETFTEDVLHGSSSADVTYAAGGTTHWDQQTWLRCDIEGVWLVDMVYKSQTLYDDDTTLDVDQRTEFYTASMLRPLEPELGDTWQRAFNYTVVSADPEVEPTPVDVIWTETVTDVGELTTPAGTFQAIEVTTQAGNDDLVNWYGEHVGFLRSTSVELVEVR